jgi:hypothetical protein
MKRIIALVAGWALISYLCAVSPTGMLSVVQTARADTQCSNSPLTCGGGATFTGGTIANPLLSPDGTVALPGQAFANAPSTGAWRGNNNLGWSRNGVGFFELNSLANGAVAVPPTGVYGFATAALTGTDTIDTYLAKDHTGGLRVVGTETSPAVSACGTGGSSVGSDSIMVITGGTGGVATSCTITLNGTYGSAPSCTVTSRGAVTGQSYTVSTTQVVITTTAAFPTGNIWDIHCIRPS